MIGVLREITHCRSTVAMTLSVKLVVTYLAVPGSKSPIQFIRKLGVCCYGRERVSKRPHLYKDILCTDRLTDVTQKERGEAHTHTHTQGERDTHTHAHTERERDALAHASELQW